MRMGRGAGALSDLSSHALVLIAYLRTRKRSYSATVSDPQDPAVVRAGFRMILADEPGHTDEDGAGAAGLTEAEVAILELEGTRCKYPEAKKAAIYDRFGCTPTRYYRVLNALIDTLAALAAAPVTVNRLRRLRRSVRASS